MSLDEGKKYWKGSEEREDTKAFQETLQSEFPEPPPVVSCPQDSQILEESVSRRSFLKAAGFSIAGTTLASCSRSPAEKVIPLLNRPEQMIPGKAYWYASTCQGCSAGCGILAKNRDGRPVKIEGNPEHPLSKGGLCAVGQAMVLGLYDSFRLHSPMMGGNRVTWPELDGSITEHLDSLTSGVYFLTATVTSLTERALINQFLSRFHESEHVEYDPVSYSAILDAHRQTHGQRLLPHYRFERAQVIVSFDADFLGTWVSPVEFTKAYSSGRTLEGTAAQLSHHLQVEGRMSLTGANADKRIKATPYEISGWLQALAGKLAGQAGVSNPVEEAAVEVDEEILDEIASRLWDARGESLVVCGVNDLDTQCLVNFINHILGNYGKTLDIERPSFQWNGHDQAVLDLLSKMQAGQVAALFVSGVNPVYSMPRGQEFARALSHVPLTVAFGDHLDETATLTQYVCPLHHPLESWDDAELVSGVISVSQPTLAPFGDTRSVRECLAAWMEQSGDDLHILQEHWREEVFPRQKVEKSFQQFWNKSVHDGYTLVEPRSVPVSTFQDPAVSRLALSAPAQEGSYSLVLYQKVSMRDGRHAHNPWLQELPDPVTKAVWDNYVCLAPAAASRLNIEEGDLVTVSTGAVSLQLPAQIQPAQHEKVVAVALGYGRQGTDRFSKIGPQWLQSTLTVPEGGTVGKNGFVYVRRQGGNLAFSNTVTLIPTGQRSPLALTQTHHTVTVPKELGESNRHMVRETSLPAYLEDPASGNHFEHEVLQLWPEDHQYTGHHWGMAIDLNRCTGCSACVISCQAENNVSVVGKDEVYRRREMHWIRIDRYYSGTEEEVEVIHQPLMCHHCDHAPCEAVCPVLATVHSDEGINQQIYNRCVGTRYCANNCPYKVRRFNWFNYGNREARENLVLNPDITTRTRGVMEKCSLCIQRIQEVKIEAKKNGRRPADGEIQTACQQSCPADAIVFGDLNDPNSRVSQMNEDPRHYRILEEMNFRPTVGYLTKVRNVEKGKDLQG